MDKLQKIAALLWEKAAREYAIARCDESEARFEARMAYVEALEDVSRCIDAALQEGE